MTSQEKIKTMVDLTTVTGITGEIHQALREYELKVGQLTVPDDVQPDDIRVWMLKNLAMAAKLIAEAQLAILAMHYSEMPYLSREMVDAIERRRRQLREKELAARK